MGRLQGVVTLVTGGARGIGRATARLFALEGAKVYVVDTKAEEGKETVALIAKAGGDAAFRMADVSVESEVKTSIGDVIQRFGGLNVLVNNAGINFVKFLEDTTEQEWDRIMAVNLKSAFLCIKHSVPWMRKAGGGSIINVGSIGSLSGQFKTPAYIVSKGAILSLTKTLALDYGRFGIRVNCVCPGITDTPMLREHLATVPNGDEVIRQRLDRVPLNRMLQPEDIAKTMLYLASEDASGVTGTAQLVDGGILAGCEYSASWPR
jgi:NAD(P)-dependent dehydrogenase (short-subunit alcohol dehydrogenase family)